MKSEETEALVGSG